jgi:hypothetical protein
VRRSLTLSHADFAGGDGAPAGFVEIARTCLRERAALVLAAAEGEDGVSIQIAPGEHDLVLAGDLRTAAEPVSGPVEFPASVMLPIAMRIRQIRLPASAMMTTGRREQPPAVFFARNLLAAAIAGRPIMTEAGDGAPGSQSLSESLRRQYWFALKQHCADPFLNGLPQVDALAHLLLATAMPLERMSDPMLKASCAALGARLSPAARERSHLKTQLAEARKRVMAAREG